ncbi:ribonuclease HI [Vibrio lentus]|uniref:Ribonuclease HI n=1 Tax=Vibrio splendidus TaxID=29497 RepID=A0A2T5EGV6_VIBSP|nr:MULTISPECIES: RNase H family protein [Vibrio]MCC4817256.1 ribonuclease HI [Vibrio lentus]OEE51752.1 ribonuclease HI [Vibrio splendidus FF-6]PMG73211.1 ribonuclease HI [Vibrio lentus]PMK91101.1 ribonuclease HI [Vibrio lentus]PML22134.1 ribonuclease HI [Vibrio lentus]
MNKEIYVDAVIVEKQRGRLAGGLGMIVLDESGSISGEDWLFFDSVTDRTHLDLSALAFGLKYAGDGDIIYSSSDYCVDGFNEWLDGWKRRNWRKANKKPIANQDLWVQVDERSADKQVEVRKVAACSAGKDAAYRYALAAANRQL